MNLKTVKTFLLTIIIIIICVPYVIFANDLRSFSVNLVKIINSAITLIMGVAFISFMIGLIRFIGTSGDDKSRSNGKQLMVWGVIALFVMTAVWGIVTIMQMTFFG